MVVIPLYIVSSIRKRVRDQTTYSKSD